MRALSMTVSSIQVITASWPFLTEVVARRGLRPEHAVTPFRHVQIDLEDARLVHDRLEHPGDHRFLALPQPSSGAPRPPPRTRRYPIPPRSDRSRGCAPCP